MHSNSFTYGFMEHISSGSQSYLCHDHSVGSDGHDDFRTLTLSSSDAPSIIHLSMENAFIPVHAAILVIDHCLSSNALNSMISITYPDFIGRFHFPFIQLKCIDSTSCSQFGNDHCLPHLAHDFMIFMPHVNFLDRGTRF